MGPYDRGASSQLRLLLPAARRRCRRRHTRRPPPTPCSPPGALNYVQPLGSSGSRIEKLPSSRRRAPRSRGIYRVDAARSTPRICSDFIHGYKSRTHAQPQTMLLRLLLLLLSGLPRGRRPSTHTPDRMCPSSLPRQQRHDENVPRALEGVYDVVRLEAKLSGDTGEEPREEAAHNHVAYRAERADVLSSSVSCRARRRPSPPWPPCETLHVGERVLAPGCCISRQTRPSDTRRPSPTQTDCRRRRDQMVVCAVWQPASLVGPRPSSSSGRSRPRRDHRVSAASTLAYPRHFAAVHAGHDNMPFSATAFGWQRTTQAERPMIALADAAPASLQIMRRGIGGGDVHRDLQGHQRDHARSSVTRPSSSLCASLCSLPYVWPSWRWACCTHATRALRWVSMAALARVPPSRHT